MPTVEKCLIEATQLLLLIPDDVIVEYLRGSGWGITEPPVETPYGGTDSE